MVSADRGMDRSHARFLLRDVALGLWLCLEFLVGAMAIAVKVSRGARMLIGKDVWMKSAPKHEFMLWLE